MNFSTFVGREWRDRGRGPEFDCWGLLVAAFEAGTGIVLPSHSEAYRTAADKTETARIFANEVGDWSDVPAGQEQEFDAMVTVIARRLHVGLMVRRGLVLHMPFQSTSRIEPLSRFPRPALYRHRRLATRGLGTGTELERVGQRSAAG